MFSRPPVNRSHHSRPRSEVRTGHSHSGFLGATGIGVLSLRRLMSLCTIDTALRPLHDRLGDATPDSNPMAAARRGDGSTIAPTHPAWLVHSAMHEGDRRDDRFRKGPPREPKGPAGSERSDFQG